MKTKLIFFLFLIYESTLAENQKKIGGEPKTLSFSSAFFPNFSIRSPSKKLLCVIVTYLFIYLEREKISCGPVLEIKIVNKIGARFSIVSVHYMMGNFCGW